MKFRNKNSEIIFAFVTVSICAIILLFRVIYLRKIGLLASLSYVSEWFYMPPSHSNLFSIAKINGRYVYIYVYAVTIVSATILIFLFKKKSIVFTAAIAAFFLTVGMQTISGVKYFYADIDKYSGKTIVEKNSLMYGPLYDFTVFCKKILPGKHRGKLITQYVKFKERPGVFLRLVLDYHLFPIDIRNITDYPEDCYIVSYKAAPLRIPRRDIAKVHRFNKANMLILRRKSD